MFRRFSAGFAVGYVLGARAGEKRYEQMTQLAERALDVPAVGRLADRASQVLTPETGRQVLQSLKDRAMSVRRYDDDDSDSYEEDEDEDEEGDFEDVYDDESEDDGAEDDDEFEDFEDEDSEDEGSEDEDSEDEDSGAEESAAGVTDRSEDRADDGDGDAERDAEGDGGHRPSRGQRGRERSRPATKGRGRPAAAPSSDEGRPHRGRIRNMASAAIERGRVD